MRTVDAIIADLKHQIYWSQPNIRFNEMSALVNELENTLSPTEEVIIEEPIVEEPVIEEVIEETIVEETPVIEEPVVAKKTTKKK
jgi:hypothetical protein